MGERIGLLSKTVSGLVLILVLTGMLTLAFNVQPAKSEWTGTVYIRADGSIDPPDAPIITYDNVTYTLTDDIASSADGIVVEKDNIILDGANYILNGTREHPYNGVDLSHRYNVTIKNMNIKNFDRGILLDSSLNNKIIGNNITATNSYGIMLHESLNNTVYKNNITATTRWGIRLDVSSNHNNITANNIVDNYWGIILSYSCNYNTIRDNNVTANDDVGIGLGYLNSYNSIIGNNVIDNGYAIHLIGSSHNIFYHNNFKDNIQQVYVDHTYPYPSINLWDDGYPSGGNYWSDYTGNDTYSGPYQNETGSDGIGDTSYVIDENNTDRYPLMSPWSPVTLTIIGPWVGTELDKFLHVLEAFEEKTGIDVEYVAYRAGELAAILPSMFEAHGTPGDVIFMWPWFIKEKGQEGHILEVTDLVNESDFSLGALDPVKVGDKLYGGAYTGKVKPGFWYRKSFFEAHGLTLPTTWDEFVALLNDIAAIPGIVNPIATGDTIGWPLSDIVEHFLITFGGPQLHKDLTAGTVSWNSSEVKAIFNDRIVPLLEGGYFSEPIEWTTALNLWWNGDYGLYFMGNWITEMVDDPDDLGVFSLPGAEGVVFGADYFFIPAYTEHMDEAKQLFQFLASAEAQSIQVAQGGHIATNIHVPLDAYPPVDRTVAEAIEGMEVLPDLDDTIGGEFQVTFWDQLKLLWVDPASLDQVLDAIQAVAPKPPPPTYNLTIIATVGGTTHPPPGTYSYTANSTVEVTAIPDAGYLFDYWELDGANVGSANPFSVNINRDIILTAVFTTIPPPLSASISPMSMSLIVGEPVTFTSTTTGGYPPYGYQWYLNGNPVSGATSDTWTFTPTEADIYYVYLKVTDAEGNTAQSDTARVAVAAVPVGGYSYPINKYTLSTPIATHIALTAILTAIFTTIKRKTKRKH